MFLYFLLALALTAADQAVKAWTVGHLDDQSQIRYYANRFFDYQHAYLRGKFA